MLCFNSVVAFCVRCLFLVAPSCIAGLQSVIVVYIYFFQTDLNRFSFYKIIVKERAMVVLVSHNHFPSMFNVDLLLISPYTVVFLMVFNHFDIEVDCY